MTISVWYLISITAFCFYTSFGLPVNSNVTTTVLTVSRENKNSINTNLSDLVAWSYNSLQLLHSVSKAIEKVILDEFDIQLKKLPETGPKYLLQQILNFFSQIRQYIDKIKKTFPFPLVDQSKELTETYVYRNVLQSFRTTFSVFRNLAGQILISYNYYLPEISFSRCVGEYLSHTYPDWMSTSVLAFPIKFIKYGHNLILEFLTTFTNKNNVITPKNIETFKNNKKYSKNDSYYQGSWHNEIDSNDILLLSRDQKEDESVLSNFEETLKILFNFDDIIGEQLGWQEKNVHTGAIVPPTKCIQLYALTALWNQLESYLSPLSAR